MLREALRRLLWLGPTLLLLTIPMFGIVAHADRSLGAAEATLPLFFNRRPVGAREATLTAVKRIANGEDPTGEEARELVDIGGAGFPHALPRLDELAPDARGRVALALAPVARRMGIGSQSELDTPDDAVLFFSRYWREHSIDFRPAVVHREVERFAAHPSGLRLGEVLELDTFALEDLIDQMRPLATASDVVRVQHLAAAAAHVADKPWTIRADASIEDAERAVEDWEDFWLTHRRNYVTLTGTRRLGATLVDTRYGHWLEHLLRHGLGSIDGGDSVQRTLELRGPTTLGLLSSGLLLGYPLAFFLGAFLAVKKRTSAEFAVLAGATLTLALGVVGVAALLAAAFGGHSVFLAFATVVACSAALALRHRRAFESRTLEFVHLRTELAFGAPVWRVVLRNLRLTIGPSVALGVSDLPTLLTAAFVVERAFSLPGLGDVTVRTAQSGDHTLFMALALFGTLSLGLAQIAADLCLSLFDPRVQSRSSRARRGRR
jgi:peptide/nickel transport system permease protein